MSAAIATEHGALAEILGRFSASDGYRQALVGRPQEPLWLGLSDLAGEPALPERLGAIEDTYGGGRDVAASFLVGWVAGAVAAPAAFAYLAEARVPVLWPQGISLRLHPDGWFDALAVAPTLVACLPDDPAAGEPDVVALPCLDDLAALLATCLVGALEPVVEAVRGAAPLGRRGLWGNVADALGAGFLSVGREIGDEERARREADRVLDLATPPLGARPRWVPVRLGDRQEWSWVRAACCLAYKTPAHSYCDTCPLLSQAERQERLRARLEQGT